MAIDDNTSYELTGAQVKDLASKINAKADNSSLATVATSGSYADLSNKPTIPAAQVNSDWDANSGVAQILNKPNLATVATSGSYTDLTNKPTIPTVNDATLTITQNGTTAGTFSANASSAVSIALTDTTYSAFTGATSSVAGASGLVPAPAAGDNTKVLTGDGNWTTMQPELVEMSYGEANAWAKFIAAYNAHCIVYCRASSNADPSSGSQTRKAFMAYVNNADSPTEVEFQYFRSVKTKTDSQQGDQTFIYKLAPTNGGTWSVETRNNFTKINVDSTLTKTFTQGTSASMSLSAKTMTGAGASTAGAKGIVPAPAAGDNEKFLRGDGTWATVQSGSTMTVYYMDRDAQDDSLYSDSQLTTAVSAADVIASVSSGPVMLYDTYSDIYLTVVSCHNNIGPTTRVDVLAMLPLSDGSGQILSVNLHYANPSATTYTYNEFTEQEALTAGTNVTISGNTISATDTTYSAFTGATSSVAGAAGLVPAPTTSDPDKFLKGDGTWGTPAAGGTVHDWYFDQYAESTSVQTLLYTENALTNSVSFSDIQNAFSAGDIIILHRGYGQDPLPGNTYEGFRVVSLQNRSVTGKPPTVKMELVVQNEKGDTLAFSYDSSTDNGFNVTKYPVGGAVTVGPDSSGRTGIYFSDGTLITMRKVQWTGNINTSWGTLYEGHTTDYYKFAPTGGNDFVSEPNVQVTLLNNGTSGSCWLGAWENSTQIVSGGWAIPAGALCFIRASTMNNAVLNFYIQAIGRWKA